METEIEYMTHGSEQFEQNDYAFLHELAEACKIRLVQIAAKYALDDIMEEIFNESNRRTTFDL